MAITLERPHVVTWQGKPVVLLGQEVNVGDMAPNFRVVDPNFALAGLSDFAGRPRLVSSVFSLETGICTDQTRYLDENLLQFSPHAAGLIISMDAPPAQARFVETARIRHLRLYSDLVWRDFGMNYGLLMKDIGMLARSLWVMAGDGRIVYREIVPEIAQHPDYEAAYQALRKAG